jgi:hypothetical protein
MLEVMEQKTWPLPMALVVVRDKVRLFHGARQLEPSEHNPLRSF